MECSCAAPESPLDAANMTATILDISRATIEAHTGRGAVNVNVAHLGVLNCFGAKLRNDTGPALNANRLHVDRDVYLIGRFEATGAGEHGTIYLLDAHFGRLACDGAKLHNTAPPGMTAKPGAS
jgi:hypothetical protein